MNSRDDVAFTKKTFDESNFYIETQLIQHKYNPHVRSVKKV